DSSTLENEVRDYVRKRASWPMMKVTGRENLQIDVRSINTTTLSEGESEFYQGDLLLHLNRIADAEPHLTAAVARAPALSTAQSSLALLRVRQKKYDDALALLKKAADADSKNPMINFYYAYVLERADADAAASLGGNPAERYETMRSYAKKSMDQSPRFIESYALLARINLNAGEHLDEAESALKKGLTIAPGRDDMRMVLAQTFLRVRTDRGTLDFHSPQPEKIQFLSYTADVTDNIKCGARNPGTPVSITYQAKPDGGREPLVVEFMQNK